MFMRRFKRDMWKAGIAIAGMLLLLVFMMWLSAPATGAQRGASGSATPGTVTVQTTPTVDATVTALNKEKLLQELLQLQQSNNRGLGNWLWSNAAAVLSSFLSTLVVVIGALIGFRQWSVSRKDTQEKEADARKAAQIKELEDRKAERDRRDEEQKRWLEDRKDEREKRAEERFQATVIGLGNEKEEAKISAAILLRTFLRPDHEQFYTQTFDLAVAHLRLPRTPHLPPGDVDAPLPLTTLSQALIVAFKESFPLARKRMKEEDPHFNPQFLDASYTQLDNANLNFADLEQAWMPQASLREANLFGTNLSEANLAMANLRGSNLIKAKLNGARLFRANLSGANLNKAELNGTLLYEANLSQANLSEANFSKASLHGTDLSGADLGGTDLSKADLMLANFSEARLFGANLSGSNLSNTDLSNADLRHANLSEVILFETNLSGADLSTAILFDNAPILTRADLRGVKGLTKEQLETYRAKGAIIDEGSTAIPSQSTVTPPQSGPDNNTQAPSVPSAQKSVPTPDTGESSATSSKPSSEP